MSSIKILIFITRYLCYASNTYFAEQLAKELTLQGASVEICDILSEEDPELYLGKFIGRTFDAVIDFNSTLPRGMAGDKPFLDSIDAPFFNYILDHPLYHHPVLKYKLNNFNVICVDEAHSKYVRDNYPHIKNVFTIPLAGGRSITRISQDRRLNRLLFTATYYPLEKYKEIIYEKDEQLQKLILELTDILVASPELTPEQAYDIMQNNHKDLPASNLSDKSEYTDIMNRLYLADIYARAIHRDNVIRELTGAGVPMILCGNDWDKCNLSSNADVKIIDPVDYNEGLEMAASVAGLLNILPGFRKGAHDRVYTAAVNGTMLVTDTNEYIDKNIDNEKDAIIYDIANPVEKADYIKEMLVDNKCRQKMCDNLGIWGQSHTWKNRAASLLENIQKM